MLTVKSPVIPYMSMKANDTNAKIKAHLKPRRRQAKSDANTNQSLAELINSAA
jgi:hypothetical protein